MKHFLSIMLLLLSVVVLTSSAFALSYDIENNITVKDPGNANGNYCGVGVGCEDQETEKGMVNAQYWDLEGFFLKGTELTMVGGYNFIKGQQDLMSGDIFLSAAGLPSEDTNYGYNYVVDLNFSSMSYEVIDLNSKSNGTFVDVAVAANSGYSTPWQYFKGVDDTVVSAGKIDYDYISDEIDNLVGKYHHAVGIDLSFLGANTDFLAHFTMECGNDNLIGKGQTAPVPEPATMILFGSGLLGLAGLRRKKVSLQ